MKAIKYNFFQFLLGCFGCLPSYDGKRHHKTFNSFQDASGVAGSSGSNPSSSLSIPSRMLRRPSQGFHAEITQAFNSFQDASTPILCTTISLDTFNSFQDASPTSRHKEARPGNPFNSFQDASKIVSNVWDKPNEYLSIPSRMLQMAFVAELCHEREGFQFLLGCFLVSPGLQYLFFCYSFNSFQDAS